ncbi:transposase InsO family protein [Salinibacter ruber]|nr:transposase InsO family protein [Salinibacter ruber]
MADVERFFGQLRQEMVRQFRRTRAASESEQMLNLIKLFVKWYNEAVT